MQRVHCAILAATACLPLFACETPPAGVIDAGAWSQALEDCRRMARLTIGYGNNFGAIGRPFQYGRNISWEIVDPCMASRGFPPPS
jgi:hypothetical protein